MDKDSIIIDIQQNNEKSIKRLIRTIRLSEGQFSLIISNCNYPGLGKIITREIFNQTGYHIHELLLPCSEKTLFSFIKSNIQDISPDVLIINNFEENNHIDQIMLSSNQVREEFREHFNYPIILLMNDHILDTFIRIAPDFRSWAGSPVLFHLSDSSLLQTLTKNADVLSQVILHSENTNDEHFLLANLYKPDQMSFFLNDIQKRKIKLLPEHQADICFLQANFQESDHQWLGSLKNYLKSYSYWSVHSDHEYLTKTERATYRQVALQYSIARCHRHNGEIESAISSLQNCLTILDSDNNTSLPVLNDLCDLYKKTYQWIQLKKLSSILKSIGQKNDNKKIQAKAYLFMAEAVLNIEDSKNKKLSEELATTALNLIETHSLQPNENNCEYVKIRDHSLYFLAVSNLSKLESTSEIQRNKAINLLEKSCSEKNYECDPDLYNQILTLQTDLYFAQKQYVKSFRKKMKRQSLQQQFGFKAFIGAGRLKARRRINRTSSIESLQATGRIDDIKELMDRIRSTDKKIIIIHGQSGVGKSSVLEADAVPTLNQMIINTYEVLPVLIRSYTDWVSSLAENLTTMLSDKSIFIHNNTLDLDKIKKELAQNSERNLFTVLIFDQFEEFFFASPNLKDRKIFYSFMKDCLNIPFVNIVLSLREDYLHFLLECDRAVDLEIIDNDILAKNLRQPLENFSSTKAVSVIQHLTQNTQFQMEDALIQRMVEDLTNESGEVRPIELQIVGYQMQEENIRTLEQYKKKETLVKKFIENVVLDCGGENKELAWIILYLLTDENNTRPLKTKEDIKNDLKNLEMPANAENMMIIFDIFTASGLVFIIPEKPLDRYQIVHDYLVEYIRKGEANELIIECESTKRNRLIEKRRQKEEEEKKRIRKKKQLQLSMTFGAVFAIIAFIAIWFGIESQRQKIRAINAEQNVREALKKSAKALANEGHRARFNQEWELSLLHYKRSLQASDNISAKIGASESLSKVFPEIARFEAKNGLSTICFSSDGKYLAYASNDFNIHILDTSTWKEIYTGKDHKKTVSAMAFHPTKNWLFSSSAEEKNILWWKIGSGGTDGKIKADKLSDNKEAIVSISISNDGKKMITASLNNIVTLWQIDEQSIQSIKKRNFQENIVNIAFSPNGSNYVIAFDNRFQLKDINEKFLWNKDISSMLKKIGSFGNTNYQNQIDGIFLCFCSNDELAYIDQKANKIVILDTNTNKFYKINDTYINKGKIRGVVHSKDGFLMLAREQSVRLWYTNIKPFQLFKHLNIDKSTGEYLLHSTMPYNASQYMITVSNKNMIHIWMVDSKLRKNICPQIHQKPVCYVNSSVNGKWLVSVSDRIEVKNIQRNQNISIPDNLIKPISAVSFSPKSARLAIAYEDKTLVLWDIENNKIFRLNSKLQFPMHTLAINPAGTTIAAASTSEWKIHFLHINKQELIIESKPYGKNDITCMTYSIDNKYLALGSKSSVVYVWDIENSSSPNTILQNHDGSVNDLIFSSDSKLLVASFQTGAIRLWQNKDNWKEGGTFWGHEKAVKSIALNSNSNLLISVSLDKSIRFWDVEHNKEISRILLNNPINSLAFCEKNPNYFILYIGTKKTIFFKELNLTNLKKRISQYFDSAYPWEFNLNDKPVPRKNSIKYALKRYENGIPWLTHSKNQFQSLLQEEVYTTIVEKSATMLFQAIDSKDITQTMSLLKSQKHLYTTKIVAEALTKAIENDLDSVADYLIDNRKIYLSSITQNLVNYNEKTPLEVAAFYNNQKLIKKLIDKGADINESFILSIEKGDFVTFNNILTYGVDINQKGSLSSDINYFFSKRRSPLASAIKTGNENIYQTLINKGADINATTNFYATPLVIATEKGDINAVTFLIKKGAEINKHSHPKEYTIDKDGYINFNQNKGYTALMSAAHYGHIDIVKLLIENGADINVRGYNGLTPLLLAAYEGYSDIVKLLTGKGAIIDIKQHDNSTPLMRAAEKGHIEVINCLIEKGADINAKNSFGSTALLIASLLGHFDVVRLLIDNGGKISDNNDTGVTLLMAAVLSGNVDIVKLFIDKGSDISKKNKSGVTSLMLAAEMGFTTIAELLIDKGADINVKNINNETALMYAANNGHINILKLLLDKGADINVENNKGLTALIAAALNGHIDILKVLFHKGADINFKNQKGFTALIAAAVNGHIDALNFLLGKGADTENKNIGGVTAIMMAAYKGNTEIVKILINKGADIKVNDTNNETALMYAVGNGHIDVLQLLLDKGAEINVKNNKGYTALMSAANNGDVDIIKILVKNGADINAKNKYGDTPLMIAVNEQHINVLELLINLGADIDMKYNGITALMYAIGKGYIDIVKLLVEKGANVHCKNNKGWSAILIAAANGHADIVKVLINKGADITDRVNIGKTVSMLACQNGHYSVCQYLIKEEGLDYIKDQNVLTSNEIKQDQKYFDALICHGSLYKIKKDSQKAYQYFQKSLDVAKNVNYSDNYEKAKNMAIALDYIIAQTKSTDYIKRLDFYEQKIESDLSLYSKKVIDHYALSSTYLSLSWYQVLTKKYMNAIQSAKESIRLFEKQYGAKMNLAHAYLLTDQFDLAKEIYLTHIDYKFPNGQSWKKIVLDDFKTMKEAGIQHPDIKKFEILLKN